MGGLAEFKQYVDDGTLAYKSDKEIRCYLGKCTTESKVSSKSLLYVLKEAVFIVITPLEHYYALHQLH